MRIEGSVSAFGGKLGEIADRRRGRSATPNCHKATDNLAAGDQLVHFFSRISSTQTKVVRDSGSGGQIAAVMKTAKHEFRYLFAGANTLS